MKTNSQNAQQIFVRLTELTSITIEDIDFLKSFCDHDKFNPQKIEVEKSLVRLDNIVCLQSPDLANVLFLEYLLFFRDPQNESLVELIEAQIQKQQDPLIKQKACRSLKIFQNLFNQGKGKNCIFSEVHKSFDKNDKNQTNNCILLKSLSKNLPTLQINNGVILNIIEFLKQSLQESCLEEKIFEFIKLSLEKVRSKMNQQLYERNTKEKNIQNEHLLSYIEFESQTKEILIIQPGKQTKKNNEKGSICKLWLFPNKSTLIDFLSKQNTKSRQKPLKIKKVDNPYISSIPKPQKVDRKVDQTIKPTVQFENSPFLQKISNIIFIIIIVQLLFFLVFYSINPHHPFIIEITQLVKEISHVFTFALSEPLEAFVIFWLHLLYPHDWDFKKQQNY